VGPHKKRRANIALPIGLNPLSAAQTIGWPVRLIAPETTHKQSHRKAPAIAGDERSHMLAAVYRDGPANLEDTMRSRLAWRPRLGHRSLARVAFAELPNVLRVAECQAEVQHKTTNAEQDALVLLFQRLL